MRLLSQKESKTALKKQEEELVLKNNRLLNYFQKGIARLNSLEDNYDQRKVNELRDFENFVKRIIEKKSQLLQELKVVEKLIEDKKSIYYGLIEKQDALQEKQDQLKERESKVRLREDFVTESEERLKLKWDKYVRG